MGEELNKKIVTATKWSSVTEIAAKLVAPVTTMLLARILTPDAFGVLVTVMMVISFAEIFTDAGFQKFLIQHEFESDEQIRAMFPANANPEVLKNRKIKRCCIYSGHRSRNV